MKHIIFFAAMLFSLTANAGVIRLSSAELLVNEGDIVDYQIFLEEFVDLEFLKFTLDFDTAVLSFDKIVNSDYFISNDPLNSDVVAELNDFGEFFVAFTYFPDENGFVPYFNGLLATLRFKALSNDNVEFMVTDVFAEDIDFNSIDVEVSTKVSAPSTLVLFALGLAFVRIRKITPH